MCTGKRVSSGTEENRLYLKLGDRYKHFSHISWKPYLLAFKLSISHFGIFHTAREILSFINLVGSYFSRGKFYIKDAISLFLWLWLKFHLLCSKPNFVSVQTWYVTFFNFHTVGEISVFANLIKIKFQIYTFLRIFGHF